MIDGVAIHVDPAQQASGVSRELDGRYGPPQASCISTINTNQFGEGGGHGKTKRDASSYLAFLLCHRRHRTQHVYYSTGQQLSLFVGARLLFPFIS